MVETGFRTGIFQGLMAVLVAVWSAVLVEASTARDLEAASDGQYLWIMLASGDQTITIYRHHDVDAPDTLVKVATLQGPMARGGLAALGETLWLVYDRDLSVQSISLRAAPLESRRHRPLPAGTQLRALAVGRDGPWALLRVESPDALAAIDRPAEVQNARQRLDHDEVARNIALGLPPGLRLPSRTTDEEAAGRGTLNDRDGTAAPVPASSEAPETNGRAEGSADPPVGDAAPGRLANLPLDRLVRLHRGRWERFDLPPDWPHQAPAWLVMRRPSDQEPLLLARHGGSDLLLYRWLDDRWSSQPYALGDRGVVAPLALQEQLVMCQIQSSPDTVRSSVSVLRSGQVHTLAGQLQIEAPNIRGWTVMPVGLTVALIVWPGSIGEPSLGVAPAQPRLRWARLDLQGNVVQEPSELVIDPDRPWDRVAEFILLWSILAMAILLVLLLWRRDPRSNQLDLPQALVLAGLGRRAVAGFIDLAPGLGLAMIIYRLDPNELMSRWPGNGNFEDIQPGALAIGVFLLHTVIGELLTARTIGKTIVGLSVVTLNGEQPRPWQLVVRGLLKGFDLVAWLLLILPLIGPYRQRLGDLVARTVVVEPVKNGR